jgi:hypothetical protein
MMNKILEFNEWKVNQMNSLTVEDQMLLANSVRQSLRTLGSTIKFTSDADTLDYFFREEYGRLQKRETTEQ